MSTDPTPQPPPPAATEADLKVFRAACESANAVIYNRHGRPWWNVEASETNEAGAKVIAAHRTAAVAAAVKQAESDRESLRACVVRLKEALSYWLRLNKNADGDGDTAVRLSLEALSLVPADLAECCVVKRSEWENTNKALRRLVTNHDLGFKHHHSCTCDICEARAALSFGPVAQHNTGHTQSQHPQSEGQSTAASEGAGSTPAGSTLSETNAALEADNRALRGALRRTLGAINAGFGKAQRDYIIAQGEATLAPKEGK